VNARFYRRGRFFWDERAATLEEQVLGPIQNAGEMGLTLDALEFKLTATAYYKARFTAAFGTADVTRARIAAALAQYVRAMVSGGSRYDRAFVANGIPDFSSVLTAEEQAGEQLFRSAGCAGCHVGIAQVAESVHNTGLDAVVTDTGAGNGAFKSPSLRNVGVRTKFMHDGRFSSLEEVVAFYDAGVQANPFLDAKLKAPDGSPRRLNLTVAQKSSLVAFLRTLTDSAFLTAPRFANPFVTPVVAPPPSAAVTIQSNSYTPATLTVGPSTVVAFTNLDNSRHSAQFDAPQIVSTPIFTSGTQVVAMPGAVGTYTYHCAIHGQAMRGAVVVR
jgi:cytochrome c peroxidase